MFTISKRIHSGDSSKWYAVVRTNVHSVIIRHACDNKKKNISNRSFFSPFLLFFFLSTVVAYSFLLDYQKGTGIFFSFFLVRSYIPIECVSVRKENWRDSRWVSETLFEMTSAMTTSTFISTFHFHLFAELWFINSDWLICISKKGKKEWKKFIGLRQRFSFDKKNESIRLR